MKRVRNGHDISITATESTRQETQVRCALMPQRRRTAPRCALVCPVAIPRPSGDLSVKYTTLLHANKSKPITQNQSEHVTVSAIGD